MCTRFSGIVYESAGKARIGYETYPSWEYALISMAKDIIDLSLFAFSVVQLLDYVKGAA
nr:MAG TPA: hypothetical protein [Caudoviricetes sp.]